MIPRSLDELTSGREIGISLLSGIMRGLGGNPHLVNLLVSDISSHCYSCWRQYIYRRNCPRWLHVFEKEAMKQTSQ